MNLKVKIISKTPLKIFHNFDSISNLIYFSNYPIYITKKSNPFELLSNKNWQRPTLPPVTAVPSALTGLTSLFGMGRGGHHRYNHHKVFQFIFTRCFLALYGTSPLTNITHTSKKHAHRIGCLNKLYCFIIISKKT